MTDHEPEPLAQYPDVLTTGEAARILRMAPEAMAAMANRGEIPGAFKVGSGERAQWRFLKARIVALMSGDAEPPSASTVLARYPEVLTTAEVAALLRISSGRTATMAKDGDLPAFKVGSGTVAPWRFPRQKLAQLMEARGVPAAEDGPPAS
ncbi:helix-turn-helix domain-containing protein [Streptomyces sp. NPDC096136]|uniref:helix-turn-helix domain-containing protein n=1 Tax=Streptomyces sp. NPDC096136 TaxID=3366076 RepID=UPI0038185F14